MSDEDVEADLGSDIARGVRQVRRLVIFGGVELLLTCGLAVGMGLGLPNTKPFWIPASVLLVVALGSLFGANARATRTTRALQRVNGIDTAALRRHGLPPRRADRYRKWRQLVGLDPFSDSPRDRSGNGSTA